MKSKTFKTACWILVVFMINTLTIQAQDAQNKTFSGTVSDGSNQPLIGVTVEVKGTQYRAITDLNGQFALIAPADKATLVFSYIGFHTLEMVADGKKALSVTMKESDNLLKETVIIGYGTTTKKEITGSISSLKQDDFNKGVFSDAMGLLQGKVAGLSVVKSGGADPMGSYEIILRGTNTLTSGQAPLVIIDGVVGESLRNISFDEVESMDVLKDGSAAAIYGTRGTNGVIIITTKRAKSGKALIEYSGQVSAQVSARRVKSLTASEFKDAINTYRPDRAGNLYGSETDWYDEITRDTPFSHRHSIALSGGTEQLSHRTAFNIEENQGLLKSNDFKKYLFKTNIIQKAFDNRLTMDINATYSLRRYHPANKNLFTQAFLNNPTTPVYDETGNYFVMPDQGTEYYNPVAMQRERSQVGKTNDFTGSARATVNIIEGLNWVNFFSYATSTWEDRSYKTKRYPGMGTRKGEASIENGSYQNKQYEMLLNYSRDFGQHALQGVAGYSFQEESGVSTSMANSNFDTDLYGTDNIGMGSALADGTASMSSFKDRSNLISFFGRLMYNYDQRYLLSLSLRREGSSRFGANNKWGWFPAVSAGWRISEESFLKEVKAVNELKLRVGYGVTGNQSFANYQSLILMSRGDKFYYNGEWINSYQPKSNPEPNLKWEMKHEYNLGVDFAMFDSRLSGTVDVYYRKVKDALFSYAVPIPPYLHETKFTNVGELSNKGIEVAINGVPVKLADFKWSTGATFALNRNKVDKFSNAEYTTTEIPTGWVGGDITVNTQKLIEGQSVGSFYGPVWVGTNELGQDMFKNANPIGEVSSESWEKIGTGLPDYTLGWHNDFQYKNWNLNFAMRASIGGDVLNSYRLYYENWSGIGKKNIINTQYRDTPFFEGSAFYSSKYIEDASFLKLDNITLAYDLPVKYKYLSKVRLSLTAQDVFCITNYKGIDPEMALSGLTPGMESLSYYPRTTSITMGVNITF